MLYASTYQRRRSQCCMNGGGPGQRRSGSRPTAATPGRKLDERSADRQSRPHRARRLSPAARTSSTREIRGRGRRAAADAAAGGGGGGGAVAAAAAGGGGGGWWRRRGRRWRGARRRRRRRPASIDRTTAARRGARRRRSGQSAPDVLQPGPHRSEQSGSHAHRRRRPVRCRPTAAARSAPVDQPVHDDNHAIWWDPNNSNHILIGTDGGAYADVGHDADVDLVSRTCRSRLFYHVGYDLETPYNVCGGMQDNYNWCGPSAARFARGITNDRLVPGAGRRRLRRRSSISATRASSTPSRRTATSRRRNKVTGESKSIRPTPANTTDTQGGGAYRFHWDTPMMFSPNDPGIAARRRRTSVFKSTDRGDSWTAISRDLTTNANRDDVVTMGVEGQRHPHRRATTASSRWPTIVSLARIAEAGRASTTPAPTTAW